MLLGKQQCLLCSVSNLYRSMNPPRISVSASGGVRSQVMLRLLPPRPQHLTASSCICQAGCRGGLGAHHTALSQLHKTLNGDKPTINSSPNADTTAAWSERHQHHINPAPPGVCGLETFLSENCSFEHCLLYGLVPPRVQAAEGPPTCSGILLHLCSVPGCRLCSPDSLDLSNIQENSAKGTRLSRVYRPPLGTWCSD